MKVPLRYVPSILTKKDRKRQIKMLTKSRKLYKRHQYFSREKVPSFKSKTSNHILNARKIYHVEDINPSKELAKASGCSVSALKKIVQKGEGAYYSSGSRPNQTAHSWGYARLASALTGGKAAAVDFSIIEKGCSHTKKAYKFAKKAKEKGVRKTRKVSIL